MELSHAFAHTLAVGGGRPRERGRRGGREPVAQRLPRAARPERRPPRRQPLRRPRTHVGAHGETHGEAHRGADGRADSDTVVRSDAASDSGAVVDLATTPRGVLQLVGLLCASCWRCRCGLWTARFSDDGGTQTAATLSGCCQNGPIEAFARSAGFCRRGESVDDNDQSARRGAVMLWDLRPPLLTE